MLLQHALRGIGDVAPCLGGELVIHRLGLCCALAQDRNGIRAVQIDEFARYLFDEQVVIVVHCPGNRRGKLVFRRTGDPAGARSASLTKYQRNARQTRCKGRAKPAERKAMPQLTDASGHTAPPSIWRDPATWSRPERAGHYRKQAVRFQRMAEA